MRLPASTNWGKWWIANVHPQSNQLGCERRKPVGPRLRIAVLDSDVRPGYPAEIAEATFEHLALADRVAGGRIAWREHADAGDLSLLRLGEWPKEHGEGQDGAEYEAVNPHICLPGSDGWDSANL